MVIGHGDAKIKLATAGMWWKQSVIQHVVKKHAFTALAVMMHDLKRSTCVVLPILVSFVQDPQRSTSFSVWQMLLIPS